MAPFKPDEQPGNFYLVEKPGLDVIDTAMDADDD